MAVQLFVGTTKEQQELKAAAELRKQKFAVWLPKTYIRRQEGRKIEARAFLRFPGYVFVHFDRATDDYSAINYTDGMDQPDGGHALLGGDKPVPVRPAIVTVLQRIEDEEFAEAVARKRPAERLDLVSGQKVQINNVRDAFHGQIGTYLGSEKKGVATLFIGWGFKEILESDLKKVEGDKVAA